MFKIFKKYGIIVVEISYLLTDYLGFGYTISSYHIIITRYKYLVFLYH